LVDGKVVGFGEIDGCMVGIVLNDFIVFGVSSSCINVCKIKYVKWVVVFWGYLIVYVGEFSGVCMFDVMGV